MFKRVLVANRGEIACRIFRTLERLGIESVAVFSDADVTAPHVAGADQACRLGPAPLAQSYLNADLVLTAALESGADAIHPGYGLLSENASFAAKVRAAGITFIGQPAGAAVSACRSCASRASSGARRRAARIAAAPASPMSASTSSATWKVPGTSK